MYVYILKSLKDGSIYIGSTQDLEQRLDFHNKGYSRYTRTKIPWELKRIEEYGDKTIALKREKFLKTGDGRKVLKNLGVY